MPDTARLNPSTSALLLAATARVALVVVASPGCGADPGGTALPNLRPEVHLTAAPRPLSETNYQVTLSWSGFDPDGRIERFEYALDPAPDIDTTWIATKAFTLTLALPSATPSSPVPPAGTVAYARDAHTFVLRAIDGAGDASPIVARSFTSRTVSPEAFIIAPIPNRQQPTSTRTSVMIRWRGADSDAIDGAGPVGYRGRLVLATAIRPTQPENVTAAQIQNYFAREADGVVPQAVAADAAAGADRKVFVVPNPYRGGAAWDLEPSPSDPTGTHVDFLNLPPAPWTLRIFTVAGDLVQTIRPTDLQTNGRPQVETPEDGQASWNLISRNGQDVTSGIYLFSVEATAGIQRGTFVLIR